MLDMPIVKLPVESMTCAVWAYNGIEPWDIEKVKVKIRYAIDRMEPGDEYGVHFFGLSLESQFSVFVAEYLLQYKKNKTGSGSKIKIILVLPKEWEGNIPEDRQKIVKQADKIVYKEDPLEHLLSQSDNFLCYCTAFSGKMANAVRKNFKEKPNAKVYNAGQIPIYKLRGNSNTKFWNPWCKPLVFWQFPPNGKLLFCIIAANGKNIK